MLTAQLTAALALLLAPTAAPVADQTPATAAQAAETVSIPAFPNSTCPVMGKAISTKLYTDTKYGRIYICCKACVKDIQADVEFAYRTAYPETQRVENEVCPVTGRTIEPEKATRVELQGRDFRVADKAAAAIALEDAQVTLTRLANPKLVDVRNGKCPILAEPVAKNVIGVIDGHIVRFGSQKAIEEARKDSKKALAKALEIRAAEERERAQAAEPAPAPVPAGG
ncbi:MAG: hypothetical protein JNK02_01230 [Planctomycetes bacterium]|nr:hypothetical protein [Planctomycetota bacterium]